MNQKQRDSVMTVSVLAGVAKHRIETDIQLPCNIAAARAQRSALSISPIRKGQDKCASGQDQGKL